jgi:hypothetical protein
VLETRIDRVAWSHRNLHADHPMEDHVPASRAPTRTLAALLLLAALAGAQAKGPTPQHSAACVAALESEAEQLADRFRQGHPEIEPVLVERVRQGFAFIGSAWKQGLRDEEADRLLKAAEEAQKSLSPEQLAERQAACRVEGAKLLAEANVLERAFVDHAAQRRVDKLKHRSS